MKMSILVYQSVNPYILSAYASVGKSMSASKIPLEFHVHEVGKRPDETDSGPTVTSIELMSSGVAVSKFSDGGEAFIFRPVIGYGEAGETNG